MIFFFWLLMAGIVAIIANSKGRSTFKWFLYGFLIWPIALVHVLVGPNRHQEQLQASQSGHRVKCPYCAELILSDAKVCRYCGKEVSGHRLQISDQNASLSRLQGFQLDKLKDE